MNNLAKFHELIDRECQSIRIYEYHIWWPKEVYLYNAILEKFGKKLNRDQINDLMREYKEKGPSEN